MYDYMWCMYHKWWFPWYVFGPFAIAFRTAFVKGRHDLADAMATSWHLSKVGYGLMALNSYLVGGLEHQFYFPILIGFIIIPIDFHIFQRGGPTTNQW